jgi:hypothetical protein
MGLLATGSGSSSPWSPSPSPTGGSAPAPRPAPRPRTGRCRPRRSSSAAGADPTTTTRLALGQRLGRMLGLVAPDHHGEERHLLLAPTRDGHPEHGPGDPALGVADLRVVGQVAGEADACLGHGPAPFVPVRFKPAIAVANQAIAELDPDSRPDPLPEELRLYDLRHTAASLMIRRGPASRRCRSSSATPRPASPWTPMGTCSLTSWTPWPTVWRTPAPTPWQPWHGPGTDHRLCRWRSRRSAGWLGVSEGGLEPPRPIRTLGPQPP